MTPDPLPLDIADFGSRPLDFRFGPRLEADGTRFRLWAPGASGADVVFDDGVRLPMDRLDGGWFAAHAPRGPGTRYRFSTGGRAFPDLASRQQAGDSAGWSVVRAPLAPPPPFSRPWHETVIAEVHVGAATPEGTFAALRERLGHFVEAGFTCLEIMPVNTFPGSRNWGYDGTLIFAPASAYGTPEELRDLVARAHELGLGMILDVVYNHFGSVDNFVAGYAPEWFDPGLETPWGKGIDFTRAAVRRFYYENAAMWLGEYGFDGLRFDAIHESRGAAREQFLGELAGAAREAKPGARLIVENVENSTRWLARDCDNRPMTFTAQWNEDLHHVLVYIVTGEGNTTGYDEPDRHPVADLEKALADGFVHDRGEGANSDGRTRGGPASKLPPDCFITYVENHDQLGNRADGRRLSARIEPRQLDFVHFVKFIAPQIPLCLMGDESNLDSPFPFFVDLGPSEGDRADARRYREMRAMFKEDVAGGALPHPNDPATFAAAKLDWAALEREPHRAALRRFSELAALRRRLVWPLTATPCTDAATARHGDGLIVSWMFEAGTLTLALNPTPAPLDMPCRVAGQPVSTGTVDPRGERLWLGPWSAMAWVG